MKRLLLLLPLLALFAKPTQAQTPSLSYCVQATQTACNSLSPTNPYSGNAGDTAWQFNTKYNTDWLFVAPLFGLPNDTLVGNTSGSANGLNYIVLGTNLSLSGNVLNATGGGGGGSVNITSTSANLTFSPSTCTATCTAGFSTTPTFSTINGDTLTAGSWVLNGGAGKTLLFNNTLTFSGTDGTTMTFPASSATVAGLSIAETFTALQTFTNSDLALLGSSTGKTTFTSGNASATNYTVTIPAGTGNMGVTAVNLCDPSGSTSGQVCVSTGPSTAPTFQSGTSYTALPSNTSVASTDLIAGYPTGGPLGTYTANQLSLFVGAASILSGSGSTISAVSCAYEDSYGTTSAASTTISIPAPTVCTPAEGQKLLFHFKFTNSQTLSWNSAYVGGTTALITAATAGGNWIAFRWDSFNSKWDYLAAATGF